MPWPARKYLLTCHHLQVSRYLLHMTSSSLRIRLIALHVSCKIVLFCKDPKSRHETDLRCNLSLLLLQQTLKLQSCTCIRTLAFDSLRPSPPKFCCIHRPLPCLRPCHVCSSSSLHFCAVDFFWVSSTAAHDCDGVSRGCGFRTQIYFDEKVDF